MLEASDLRTVTMRAEQWQYVLSVLNEAPHRVAAPLITAIVQQCTQSTTPSEPELP